MCSVAGRRVAPVQPHVAQMGLSQVDLRLRSDLIVPAQSRIEPPRELDAVTSPRTLKAGSGKCGRLFRQKCRSTLAQKIRVERNPQVPLVVCYRRTEHDPIVCQRPRSLKNRRPVCRQFLGCNDGISNEGVGDWIAQPLISIVAVDSQNLDDLLGPERFRRAQPSACYQAQARGPRTRTSRTKAPVRGGRAKFASGSPISSDRQGPAT